MKVNTDGYEHVRFLDDLVAYVEHHQPVGHFLTAVLSNDLLGAFMRADDASVAALHEIVAFIYNRLPLGCYGSRAKVDAWLRMEAHK